MMMEGATVIGAEAIRRQAYIDGYTKAIKDAAEVARKRQAICNDAVNKVKAGTLYQGVPAAAETEMCAMMEARHIATLIEALGEKKDG